MLAINRPQHDQFEEPSIIYLNYMWLWSKPTIFYLNELFTKQNFYGFFQKG